MRKRWRRDRNSRFVSHLDFRVFETILHPPSSQMGYVVLCFLRVGQVTRAGIYQGNFPQGRRCGNGRKIRATSGPAFRDTRGALTRINRHPGYDRREFFPVYISGNCTLEQRCSYSVCTCLYPQRELSRERNFDFAK